jgi:hypothetical protein
MPLRSLGAGRLLPVQLVVHFAAEVGVILVEKAVLAQSIGSRDYQRRSSALIWVVLKSRWRVSLG